MPVKYQSWENPRCEILKALYKYRHTSREICLICKGGRLLCGRSSCPLLKEISVQTNVIETLKSRLELGVDGKNISNLFGKSPSIFVGWKNYPNVFLGPLNSMDENRATIADNPSLWYGKNFDEIIELRSLLVRGMSKTNVYEISNFIEKNQEIALSINPIDIEITFKKTPKFHLSFSPISQPMGPTGELKNLKIVENPKIPKITDEIIEDNLNSSTSLFLLYKEGNFDVYYLSKVLSSGSLGKKENKKLVPTRWSITAVDDIIGKFLIKDIKSYEKISEINVFSNEYLFNHFEILLIPGNWEFEQFEAWAPDTLWTIGMNDYTINLEAEYYKGRNDYALKEGGGYYASRLAVLEYLEKIKKQARVIIFREIYEGYIMPVGVWEVRENVRNAFKKNPKKFNTIEEALKDIEKNLKIPINEYLKRSQLLTQKRLIY